MVLAAPEKRSKQEKKDMFILLLCEDLTVLLLVITVVQLEAGLVWFLSSCKWIIHHRKKNEILTWCLKAAHIFLATACKFNGGGHCQSYSRCYSTLCLRIIWKMRFPTVKYLLWWKVIYLWNCQSNWYWQLNRIYFFDVMRCRLPYIIMCKWLI